MFRIFEYTLKTHHVMPLFNNDSDLCIFPANFAKLISNGSWGGLDLPTLQKAKEECEAHPFKRSYLFVVYRKTGQDERDFTNHQLLSLSFEPLGEGANAYFGSESVEETAIQIQIALPKLEVECLYRSLQVIGV